MESLLFRASAVFRPEDGALSLRKKTQIQIYRLLSVLGAALNFLFVPLYTIGHAGATDPLWARIAVSGLLLALFGLSYGPRWVRRNYEVGVQVGLYGVFGWFIWIAALNRFAADYALGLLLLYAVSTVILQMGCRTIQPVLWFLGVGFLATAGAIVVGPASLSSTPVLLGSMATLAVLESVTIQAHLATRETLHEREERLRAITENVSDGIYRSVPGDGLVYVNQALAEMFGYDDPEELRRVDPATLYSTPEERPERQEQLQQSEFFDGHEVEFRRRDGSTFTGLLSGTVVRDDDGSVRHYDGAIADITAQKRAERALRREQAALHQMYRITADQEASFESKTHRLLDLGREYLGVSEGFLSRISEETQEIVHALGTHPDLQPGATCPLSESYCRKTIDQDGLLTVHDARAEDWAGDPGYEKFELGTYIGAKVVLEGELYGTFCFADPDPREEAFTERERTFVELMTQWASYELEQRRAARRLRRKNERLDSFASVLSHDLRNPLNVANIRLDLARADDDTLEHLAVLESSLDRMDQIIQDVLALARTDQEIPDEDRSPLALPSVAETSWAQVDTGRATLQVEGEGTIQADAERLRRLLENLFRNAVEHGGSDVTVRVGAHENGFYVADDGPGIPPEERDAVFEDGHSGSSEGTGLGLGIVRNIAEAHGWTPRVTKGRAGGARFEMNGAAVERGTVEKSRAV